MGVPSYGKLQAKKEGEFILFWLDFNGDEF